MLCVLCSCLRPQDKLIPCGHALAVLNKVNIDPYRFISHVWSVSNWQCEYSVGEDVPDESRFAGGIDSSEWDFDGKMNAFDLDDLRADNELEGENCLFKDYMIKVIALMWHHKDEWEFSETVKPPILTNCQTQEVLLHRARPQGNSASGSRQTSHNPGTASDLAL